MSIVTLTMNPAIDISATVPRVTPIHKLRCTTVRREAGGGGVNVARVVVRLGGKAHAVFPIGGGHRRSTAETRGRRMCWEQHDRSGTRHT